MLYTAVPFYDRLIYVELSLESKFQILTAVNNTSNK